MQKQEEVPPVPELPDGTPVAVVGAMLFVNRPLFEDLKAFFNGNPFHKWENVS